MMQPDFSIVVDGYQNVTDAIRKRLIEVKIDDQNGLDADTLTISLADDGTLAMPREGAILTVCMGYQNTLVDRGVFHVDYTEVTPQTMTIVAHAANLKNSIKVKQTKAWENIKFIDCLAVIAHKHGLRYAVHKVLSNHIITRADQVNESDAHFLQRMAKAVGAVFKVSHNVAIITPIAETSSVSGMPIQEIAISKQELIDFTVKTVGKKTYNGAKAHWYDTKTAITITETIGTAPYHINPRTHATKAAALAAIKTISQSNKIAYQADVTLLGNASISYATTLNVILRTGINARWMVTSVNHMLNKDDFVSKVRLRGLG